MPASVAYSEDGEDSDFIIDIDALQAHGINVADIAKLRSANLHTVASVHGSMTKNLIKIKGMSETKVEKIKEAVNKCMSDSGGFKTSAELLQLRRRCFRLQTGSKQLDAILNGGFQSSSVSEVFGEYRCGKTQLAHTLCVTAQLEKEKGGCPPGKVAYIDTEGTYRPQRIIEIAHRFNVDPDTASENIIYIRADNSENQHTALLRLAEHFVSGEFRLLIIDSICALFRVDYQGRGELSERQQKLGQHLSVLTRMAEEFNLAVFITNQVQSDPGASALFASADGRKPIGGHVVAHASATRIMLRKGRGLERVAKIVDSPDCPESEATYIITTGGIDDPDKA